MNNEELKELEKLSLRYASLEVKANTIVDGLQDYRL